MYLISPHVTPLLFPSCITRHNYVSPPRASPFQTRNPLRSPNPRFLRQEPSVPHITYMQTSLTQKIPLVTLPDRKPFLDYPTGKISSSDSIVSVNHHKPTLTNLPMEGNSLKANINDGNVESLNISLRPLDVSDIDDFLVWTTDDKVNSYCEWELPRTKRAGILFIQHYAASHEWYRAICLNNRVIGTISVNSNSCRAELTYVLASKYWGKGIMTQEVKIVANTIFSEWSRLERLEALVDVENMGSQKVLDKVGFKREGVLRKYVIQKGSSRDMVMFSLLSTDPKIDSL